MCCLVVLYRHNLTRLVGDSHNFVGVSRIIQARHFRDYFLGFIPWAIEAHSYEPLTCLVVILNFFKSDIGWLLLLEESLHVSLGPHYGLFDVH